MVLVKVDKATKMEMKKVKANWSEEIRGFIKERLRSGGEKNMARAVAITDRLFREGGFSDIDSVEAIRKMRDTRYGPRSNGR